MHSFKKMFCLGFILFHTLSSNAQTGCPDPEAANYNSKAKQNDGSCIYPLTHVSPNLKSSFSSGISESSGIVFTNGKLWTHNDAGNPPIIFSVEPSTGKTIQTVYIDNYPNNDWEDITADSNSIYICDCGNNNGTRTNLKILKITKTDIGNAAIVHVNAKAISYSYSDQANFTESKTHNFDCESLITIGNSLYIFTKDRGDLQTRVYRLSKMPGEYIVSPYTGFNVNGLITGAAYDPVEKEVALIGYFKGHTNSFMWLLNDFKSDSFFSGNKRRIEIGNGGEWQTEGICYDSTGKLFISCEKSGNINSSLFITDKGTWIENRPESKK